jgi:hypothetical protein
VNDEPDNEGGGFGEERWKSSFDAPPATTPATTPVPTAKTRSSHSRRVGIAAVTVAIATVVRLAGTLGPAAWPIGGDEHATANTPAAVARTMPVVFYGDLKQIPPSGVPRGSAICSAEVRMRAAAGAWTCVSWTPTGTSDAVLRAAGDSGDRCTHRIVEAAGSAWTCETTIPPPAIMLNPAERSRHPFLFADLKLSTVAKRNGRVCTEEVRPSRGGGSWHCLVWERVDPSQHFVVVQPIDPGGPCTLRSVDELTGVWICETGGPTG